MNITSTKSSTDEIFLTQTEPSPKVDINDKPVNVTALATAIRQDGTVRNRYNRYVYGVTPAGTVHYYMDWDGARRWSSNNPGNSDSTPLQITPPAATTIQRTIRELFDIIWETAPRTVSIKALSSSEIGNS